jgi:large subunit ribosomal protein L22
MADEPKTEFRAKARGVRMSARKARLVADAVRGKAAEEAMVALSFVNKRAAPVLRKLIESAVANAEEYANREGIDVDPDQLVVAEVMVDEGPRMKRWRPRSRGMANPYTRYTCHMRVMLCEADELAKRETAKPAWRKPRKRISQEERLKRKAAREGKPEAEAKAEKKAEKKPAKKAEKKTEAATEESKD